MSNTTFQHSTVRLAAALVLCLAVALPSQGGEFALFGGKVLGVWRTNLAYGVSVRAGSPEARLIGAGAQDVVPGASGAVGVNDDYQLNFRQNEIVSAPLTLMSEMTLHHQSNQGIFIRVRGWYDTYLESRRMPHGHGLTAYEPDQQLRDTNFLGAARFHGIDIYDAFFYGHYKAGETRFLLRLGRQVVDWGEGLLYPGINAFNPLDAAWATMSGAKIANKGRLPVNRIFTSVALPKGFSVDGFYNLEWRETVVPGCGTYFSFVDDAFHPGCNVATGAGQNDRESANLIGTPVYYGGRLAQNGIFSDGGPEAPEGVSGMPSRWSGWGLALRKFVEPLQTELGFYYTNYTSPFATITVIPGEEPIDLAVQNMWVEGIQSFAISAATGVREVALSAQFTYTTDLPGQKNFPHLMQGALEGRGMYADAASDEYINREYEGYYPLDVASLQFGGTWQFGHHVGLRDATLTGEANLQWVTNHPGLDGPDAQRLGRYGNFGIASWNQPGGECDPGPLDNGIINDCEIDGFVNDFAAGYKLFAKTTLPQVGPNITLTPTVTITHDITGYSADGAITGGRFSIGAFLRADINQDYFIQGGAVLYYGGAKWDSLRDRGQYVFSMGVNL